MSYPHSFAWKRLLLGAAALLAMAGLWFWQPHAARAQGGVMAVDCATAPGIQSQCQYAPGDTFTVQVHLVELPKDGNYHALQIKLAWEAPLTYHLASDLAAELPWPECDIPARADNRPADSSALWGCVPFPRAASTYLGPVLEVSMQCLDQGSTALRLVPRPGDPQNGTYLLDEHGEPVDTVLTGAVIGCGVAPEGEVPFWDPSMPPPEPPLPPPPLPPTGPTEPAPAPAPSPPPPPQPPPQPVISPSGARMEVDCATAPGVQSSCQYAPGETFTVQVHLVELPKDGNYHALQVKLAWEAPLTYLPAPDLAAELPWPECDIPARADNRPADNSALWGCVPFPRAASTYLGPVLEVSMQCLDQGLSALRLVPRPGDPQNGTQLLDEGGHPGDAVLTGAVIGCGVAPEGEPPSWDPATAPPPPTSRTLLGPRMEVDCDAAVSGVQSSCRYEPGETFTVQIHLTDLPRWVADNAGGEFPYYAFQLKLAWEGPLTYQPALDPAAELPWPECDISARLDNRPAENSAVWACVSHPQALSTYLGPILEISVQCLEEGQTVLYLVPGWRDPEFGTVLLHEAAHLVGSAEGFASIGCGVQPPMVGFVEAIGQEAESQGAITGVPGGGAPALVTQLLAQTLGRGGSGPQPEATIDPPSGGSLSAEIVDTASQAPSHTPPVSQVAAVASPAPAAVSPQALPAAGSGRPSSADWMVPLAALLAVVGLGGLLVGVARRAR